MDNEGSQTSDKLPEAVDAYIAGVQGQEGASRSLPSSTEPASPPTVEPVDAGEIEWAGTILKKPPHPGTQ